jgi:D-3-phosphoglycerate dehydrogenase / 2-oxoglutarate reductase
MAYGNFMEEKNMAKHKVVLTDNIFPDLDIERELLDKAGADLIEIKNGIGLEKEVEDADAVINTYAQVPAELIGKMEKCKLIIRNGIGVNTIDVDACNKKGIMVANIPTYCLDEVATHAMALLLALNRKILPLDKSVHGGTWDVKKATPVYALPEKTLGLVGFGKIPRMVHEKAKAFGMKVIIFDPYVSKEDAANAGARKVEIQELIAESDYISIHCPLTPETRGMFNYEAFCSMKKTAYIINTARGPIVNEPDLARALEEGEIAGAGLDVLMKDEVSLDNPLLKFDNVIITPHAAWYSEESIVRRRVQTVESVIEVLQGREPFSFLNKKALNS